MVVIGLAPEVSRTGPTGAVAPEGYVWVKKLSQYVREDIAGMLPALFAIKEGAARGNRDGGTAPSLITNYPLQIFHITRWGEFMTCRENTQALEVEGTQQNLVVERLCRSCPVQLICLATDLKRGLSVLDGQEMSADPGDTVESSDTILNKTIFHVRGAKTTRERIRMLREAPDKARGFVAAVDRATNYQTLRLDAYTSS